MSRLSLGDYNSNFSGKARCSSILTTRLTVFAFTKR